MNDDKILKLLVLTVTTIMASPFVTIQSIYGQNATQMTSTNEGEVFHDDFELEGDNQWYNVSGKWSYTLEGLHGGQNDTSPPSLNNVLISPASKGNEFNISTSFRVNDVFRDGDTAHYGSIVYSFVDPENYEHAGVNIHQDDIYIVISKIVNSSLYHEPTWLGIKTDLVYEPGTLFNLAVSGQGTEREVILNGTKYSIDTNGPPGVGFVGLNYGMIKDIDFYSFQSNTSQGTQAIDTHEQPNNEALTTNTSKSLANTDGLVTGPSKVTNTNTVDTNNLIFLDGKEIPSGEYLHVYDSSPYNINSGTVTARIPCDSDGISSIVLLIGNPINLNQVEMKPVSQISETEDMCSYESTLSSNETNPSTDVILQNNSPDDIIFPPTSSVLLNIGDISEIK